MTENGLFFEKLGIDKFSAAGESTTVFLGWPSASKNISKSPWLRNGTMKRKRKFIKWALIWCASITAEKLVNIFKTFLKFGYLSLRSMGLYLPSCTSICGSVQRHQSKMERDKIGGTILDGHIKDQLQRSKKIRNLAVVCWIISYYRHLYHENLDSSLYLLKKIHFRNPFLPRYIARFAKGACRHRLINISWIQLFPPLDDVRPGKRYTSWFTCYTSNA